MKFYLVKCLQTFEKFFEDFLCDFLENFSKNLVPTKFVDFGELFLKCM